MRPIKGITMGYAILPDLRGLGLATEAAAAVMAWAEQRNIDVYASVRPPNPASVRVLTKIGMRLPGWLDSQPAGQKISSKGGPTR